MRVRVTRGRDRQSGDVMKGSMGRDMAFHSRLGESETTIGLAPPPKPLLDFKHVLLKPSYQALLSGDWPPILVSGPSLSSGGTDSTLASFGPASPPCFGGSPHLFVVCSPSHFFKAHGVLHHTFVIVTPPPPA